MKQLLILGTGCSRCAKLYEVTEQAAKETGVSYGMSKVTDLKQIMAFGVMATPALVIDGSLKLAGRVPSVEEVKRMLV